jgi:hypothetical protein
MRWKGHVAQMGMINLLKISIGKLERKTSPWRSRCRWENNIKMYLEEIKCECEDWTHIAIVNTVMNIRAT